MKGLFTYDMIRDIWIPLLSGIIGGLFTLVGVVLTVRYERKKEQRDYMEKIKPYLVVQHLSDLSKDDIQHLKKASIPNDSPNPCVSITPNHIYYHWENLVISNIGNYACILAYIKINNSPYAFPTKSPIKPGESFQIVGQWVSVYIFPEIESISLGIYDCNYNLYEYSLHFRIAKYTGESNPKIKNLEKVIQFDTIDCNNQIKEV